MPRVVDHDARRTAILEAAFPLVAAHGYEGAGIREVAQAVGISRSALYHYFPSKEALFAGLIERLASTDLALVEAVGRGRRSERVDRLFAVVRSQARPLRDQVRVLEQARRHAPEQLPRIRELTDRFAPALALALDIEPAVAEQLHAALNGLLLAGDLLDREPDWEAAQQAWTALLR